MATQSAQFDLSTAFLDIPDTIGYGLVRGAGNKILQQELTDKSRVAFYILGRGPWDSLLRLWINNKRVTLPSSGTVHFHPGIDGEIGNGLAAASTGGDQHVDQFFTLIPGGLDPVTFSRYAWLALKVAPDPAAPSADLTVLADYQAQQVRQFDASGNQTAFAWTQNWAWIICDFLINKFVLRDAKANQPLVAAELSRFDWPSFSAAATYYDTVLAGGQKRFSDGGLVFLNDTDTADRALEQMLMMCRSYLLERNGKLSLYPDQPRATVFTFTTDNTKASTFKAYKSNQRAASNRITAAYRDSAIASGSSDDATRFAISTVQVDHEAHQRAIGVRGAGLSVVPKVTELRLDLGVNTAERIHRIANAMLIRQLGDDVDGNTLYNAPFAASWTGFEDSLAVEPGDVVTIDSSISEEFGGKQIEVLEPEYLPNGEINYVGLEYMANAFPDGAPAQQALQAPNPGTGLTPGFVVDPSTGTLIAVDLVTDNLCRNGDFVNGAENWSVLFGAGNFYSGSSGLPRGSTYFETNTAVTELTSNEFIPIDTNKTYLIECWMWINGGSSPVMYGGFADYDGSKTYLLHDASGAGFGYPLFVNLGSTGGTYQYFAAEITGSALHATPNQFAQGCKFIRLNFLFNWTGTVSPADVVLVGVRFSEVGAGNRRAMNALDANAIAVATAVDFSRSYTGKNLDNMPDGTRAAWDSIGMKTAAVDTSGNLLLKNISGGTGSTVQPSTTSTTYSVVPEMAFTLTTKGNKVLIIFTASIIVNQTTGPWSFFAIFRDGVQLTPDFQANGVTSGGALTEIIGLTYLDSPSAGSHTYDVRWKTNSTTYTLVAYQTARSLQVVELG